MTGEGAALVSVRSVGVGEPAIEVTGTTGEGDDLAPFRSIGLGSSNNCGGGYDRCWRCSGLYWMVRRVFSQPLWLRARNMMALLWNLYVWSAWAQANTMVSGTTFRELLWLLFVWTTWGQPSTVVAVTTGEGAALASVHSVGIVSDNNCGG